MRVTLLMALVVMTVALGVVLSESPPKVLATNTSDMELLGGSHAGPIAACQDNERLPMGTTAIRLSLSTFAGPKVKLAVYSGHRLVASGVHASTWSGRDVTIAVKPRPHAVSPVRICYATSTLNGEIIVYGKRTEKAAAASASRGSVLKGRVKIDYLGAGHTSWLALASSVARHMAYGRAWNGTGVVFLVLVLMFATAALASWLVTRGINE